MPIDYRGFEINAEGDPAWAQREIDFHKDVIDYMLDTPQGANMIYKSITKTGQSPGQLNLSDATTWNISKAQIDYIDVQVASGSVTKFDIDVYEDNTFAGKTRYSVENIRATDGWTDDIEWIYVDADDTKEIHIKITEVVGSGSTYNIHLRGIQLT
jgi:hypothetical protein